MYSLGLPLAILLNIGVMITTHMGSMMYLHVKNIVPGKPESLYEIGFMLYGRKSIFILGSILFILACGLCMIYFIVFGDTFGQFVANFTEGKESLGSVWYTSRWCYSVPLALILIPFCLKKQLSELDFMAKILFVALGIFLIVNFIQLAFNSKFEALAISTDILAPKMSIGTISALSVTCLAYSYQQNIFPIFWELKERTYDNYSTASKYAMTLVGAFYLIVGIIGAMMFGHTLKSSVLLNIGIARHFDDPTKGFFEAYISQISFMIVLMCHIPFIFFSGKEALLICVDEI